MDIQTRKIEFVQEFLKLKSERAISLFENLLKKTTLDETEEEKWNPMSVDEFNKRIDQAMDDSKNGRSISSEELKSRIEKWG